MYNLLPLLMASPQLYMMVLLLADWVRSGWVSAVQTVCGARLKDDSERELYTQKKLTILESNGHNESVCVLAVFGSKSRCRVCEEERN